MICKFRFTVTLAAVLGLSVLSGCTPEAPAIRIVSALAPATPPGTNVGAVYIELVAAADDVLVDIATPIADRTEIHESTESEGTMQMRHVTNLPLTAGEAVRFAPGGLHLMLMNLHKPLLVDSSFPVDLHLQKAGIITVNVQVVPPGTINNAH